MPKIVFRHDFDVPAEKVWRHMLSPSALFKASAPVVFLQPHSDWGQEFRTGRVYSCQLKLMGIIPWGRHEFEFVSLSSEQLSFTTSERGEKIKFWEHHQEIVKTAAGCCALDTITFEAGSFNSLVWVLSQVIYRWRYYKRQRILLAKS